MEHRHDEEIARDGPVHGCGTALATVETERRGTGAEHDKERRWAPIAGLEGGEYEGSDVQQYENRRGLRLFFYLERR